MYYLLSMYTTAIRTRLIVAVLLIAIAPPLLVWLCIAYPSVMLSCWDEGWMADPAAHLPVSILFGMLGWAAGDLTRMALGYIQYRRQLKYRLQLKQAEIDLTDFFYKWPVESE